MQNENIYTAIWADMQEAARNEILAYRRAHPDAPREIANMEVIVANFCLDPAPRDDHECSLREMLLGNIRKNIRTIADEVAKRKAAEQATNGHSVGAAVKEQAKQEPVPA